MASTDTGKVRVVAHRGASKFAPENTIPALEVAIEMGADMAEIDVRQTKDGHFVLMHDETLERTTNGTGKVKDRPLKYIQSLDAGSWFSKEYAGTKVPALREVLQSMKGRVIPDLDFKEGDVTKLVDVLRKQGFLANGSLQVTFHSGKHPEYFEQLRTLTDKVAIRPSFIANPAKLYFRRKYGTLEAFKRALNPEFINIDWEHFSEEYIDQIHKHGIQTFVNTLNEHDSAANMQKAIQAGADYIQSDNLDLLIPLVQDHNAAIANGKP